MDKNKQSLFVEFRKNTKKTYILIIYLIVSLVCNMLCNDINRISYFINSPLNIFDGFLMINNNLYSNLFLTIGIMLINSNSPFMDENQYFILIRTGKHKWLNNRIALCILNVILYVAIIFIFTAVFTMENSFCANYWSDFVRGTATGLTSVMNLGPPAILSLSMINNLSIFEATIHAFMLMTLYWIFLSMLIMIINIKLKRNLGFIFALIIHFVGWILNYLFSYILEYISPMNNSMLIFHSFGFNNGPTLLYSYIFYFILIVLLILLSKKMINKFDF